MSTPQLDPNDPLTIPVEPKSKPSFFRKYRHLIYLTVGAIIFIVGLILTPAFPDELIGEVILGLVILFIETRKKSKNLKKLNK